MFNHWGLYYQEALGFTLKILQGILRGGGWGWDFLFNWKFSCKLANFSAEEMPRAPGVGQCQGEKKDCGQLGRCRCPCSPVAAISPAQSKGAGSYQSWGRRDFGAVRWREWWWGQPRPLSPSATPRIRAGLLWVSAVRACPCGPPGICSLCPGLVSDTPWGKAKQRFSLRLPESLFAGVVHFL